MSTVRLCAHVLFPTTSEQTRSRTQKPFPRSCSHLKRLVSAHHHQGYHPLRRATTAPKVEPNVGLHGVGRSNARWLAGQAVPLPNDRHCDWAAPKPALTSSGPPNRGGPIRRSPRHQAATWTASNPLQQPTLPRHGRGPMGKSTFTVLRRNNAELHVDNPCLPQEYASVRSNTTQHGVVLSFSSPVASTSSPNIAIDHFAANLTGSHSTASTPMHISDTP